MLHVMFCMSLLSMCLYDLKTRQVPIWLLLIFSLCCVGIGVSSHHPFLSLILAVIVGLVFLRKVGAADNITFPMLVFALNIVGILVIFLTYLISFFHVRKFENDAPMLSYLFIVYLLYLSLEVLAV